MFSVTQNSALLTDFFFHIIDLTTFFFFCLLPECCQIIQDQSQEKSHNLQVPSLLMCDKCSDARQSRGDTWERLRASLWATWGCHTGIDSSQHHSRTHQMPWLASHEGWERNRYRSPAKWECNAEAICVNLIFKACDAGSLQIHKPAWGSSSVPRDLGKAGDGTGGDPCKARLWTSAAEQTWQH